MKYIRLTKTQSNLQASVKNLTLVDILIQLPSNKISIVFWWKGQVVRLSTLVTDCTVIMALYKLSYSSSSK